jgi:putative serine protease PepD
MRSQTITISAVVVAVATMLAGCGGSKRHASSPPTTAAPKTASSARSTNAANAIQNAFVQVVKDVSPSVVQIETRVGLGSGVVYDGRGDIVTNAHVVGTFKRFTVTLSSGERRRATLVGSFAPNDLAVIRVGGAAPPAATFADSSKIAVGDIDFAIGNPLGFRSSVTQGIVSSLGRTVGEGNGVALASVIQTSAAINPGNSGGALVNLDSEVIGIPTLAALDPVFGGTPAAGIGFAIPSNTVKLIANQLIRSGKVTESGRAYLGVTVATLSTGGVYVTSVKPGGPAAAAGIKPGDLIVKFDKTPVVTTDGLATALAQIKPGSTVSVVVDRNGKKRELRVKVGELTS